MNRSELDNTRVLLPPNKDAAFRRLKIEREIAKKSVDTRRDNRLKMFFDRRIAGMILPEERVCACGRIPISAPGARIQVSGETGKYFSGIMNCGSVWNCPVCAKKIGLHRAATVTTFLREFLDWKKERKYSLGFLTLTVRHHRGEALKDVLKKVLKTFRDIEQSRAFRARKKADKYFGCIRTVEVKHGGNGWHPHLHLLLVADCDEGTLEGFAEFFIGEWMKREEDCSRAAQKYLPVRDDNGISDYVTKWNAATEMTMGSVKNLGESVTPFQMLRAFNRCRIKKGAKDYYKEMLMWQGLFQEYSKAMKGKKQLTFARDLIREYERISGKKFSMKSDEEINSEDQHDKKIVEIDREIFKLIASYHLQAEVLNVIEFESVESCVSMLNECCVECEFDPVRNIIQEIKPPEPEFVYTSQEWERLVKPV